MANDFKVRAAGTLGHGKSREWILAKGGAPSHLNVACPQIDAAYSQCDNLVPRCISKSAPCIESNPGTVMSRKRSFIVLGLLVATLAVSVAVFAAVVDVIDFQFWNVPEVLVLCTAVWIVVVAVGFWQRCSRRTAIAEFRTSVAQHWHEFGFTNAMVSIGACIMFVSLGQSSGTTLFAVGFIVVAVGGGWGLWLFWLILRAWSDRSKPSG